MMLREEVLDWRMDNHLAIGPRRIRPVPIDVLSRFPLVVPAFPFFDFPARSAVTVLAGDGCVIPEFNLPRGRTGKAMFI